LSGVLMGLTVAPFELWGLAWVAIVPLWVLLARSPTRVWAFSLSLAWGIGYHAIALFWITGVHPMTWMGVPWLASLAIALFCWVFITLWGAMLVAVWGLFLFEFRTSTFKIRPGKLMERETEIDRLPKTKFPVKGDRVTPVLSILVGTALWCILESLWSATPLWWPWLGLTQSPHNLVILHLGQLSGPSTVAAAIVAVNGFLAEAWIARFSLFSQMAIEHRKAMARGYSIVAAAILIGSHGLGFWLFDRPLEESPETALKVGIIQGNIPNEIKLYPGGIRRALEGYVSGYRTLADEDVEVILTPETALPVLWTQANRFRRDSPAGHLYRAILERGVPIWIGGFGLEESEGSNNFTNSLFSVDGDGKTSGRYDKIKLVPLGEYIPFENLLGQIIDRLSPLDAHLVAGEPGQTFDTPFGRAIVGICYESAFPQHFRRQAAAGGEFILSAANNAHYAESMPAQHHAQDVMRAIETDRPAVRATNTGYSAIVDPHGKTLWQSGINTYQVRADTIYRRTTQTLYVRWGNWLVWMLGILGAIAIGWQVYWKDDRL
ncbi:apolipoprotein N-acyltransferase, partial [Oscillatoriales cyanobacterium LEGE 11467]